MSIYDDHPAESWIDVFIEDYLHAVEGDYLYWRNHVIARIASPELPGTHAFGSEPPPAATGEAVGAQGRYPMGMQQDLK